MAKTKINPETIALSGRCAGKTVLFEKHLAEFQANNPGVKIVRLKPKPCTIDLSNRQVSPLYDEFRPQPIASSGAIRDFIRTVFQEPEPVWTLVDWPAILKE